MPGTSLKSPGMHQIVIDNIIGKTSRLSEVSEEHTFSNLQTATYLVLERTVSNIFFTMFSKKPIRYLCPIVHSNLETCNIYRLWSMINVFSVLCFFVRVIIVIGTQVL